MSKPTILLVLTLCCLSSTTRQAAALETDQFMVWELDLVDSTDRLNDYINARVQIGLDQINRGSPHEIECEDIPEKVYRRMFQHLLYSRVRRFLAKDAAIERYPADDVGYWEYLDQSIFRKPAFPFILPMARSIRINGINMGVDKIGHMFGFGRRYYVRYRRALNQGRSSAEAVRRPIAWGYRLEGLTVGGLVDGVVSYGDLEANYQGMRLARDFCEDLPPFLTRQSGRWKLSRPIDLRRYVNPAFDETYNHSYFTKWRWKKVKPILQREYCPQYRQSRVQELMRSYAARDPGSVSRDILKELESKNRSTERSQQSLEAICNQQNADGEAGLIIGAMEERSL